MIQQPGSTERAAYFVRESESRFRPTIHVGGGWNPNEQHIAPSIGLLAHVVQLDMAKRRPDELQLVRLSCDILGTIPMESVDIQVEVIRPGRTIELVEVRMSHGGRTAVLARAWLSARFDSAAHAGSAFAPLPPREQMERWPNSHWPGGFVKAAQIWQHRLGPGRVQYWLRSDVELLAGEEVSPTARMLRLIDVANGVAARAAPEEVAFPNLDLTAHLYREPVGEFTGLDSVQSYGPSGVGLTESVLHDEQGPFGSFSQILTVRPR